MFSYLIALLAAAIFLINPISQLLFSDSDQYHNNPHTTQNHLVRRRPSSGGKLSPRPQLNESLLALDRPGDAEPECGPDAYVARILRREPLVVYLEGFLSDEERRHLLEESEPIFEPSTIINAAHSSHLNTTVRDSSVALLPRTQPVRCIERRALALQGRRRDVFLERLRAQRYVGPGGHYSHHFDWSGNTGGWGRVSSFMAWVDASEGLVGGGTEFPLLERKGEWCGFVECGEEEGGGEGQGGGGSSSGSDGGGGGGEGVVFKVKPGNAVYWENFAADGRGYEETWHAGLPVTEGVKVGLNIWSFGRIEG